MAQAEHGLLALWGPAWLCKRKSSWKEALGGEEVPRRADLQKAGSSLWLLRATWFPRVLHLGSALPQAPGGGANREEAPRRARKRAEGTASSNVFSMFDQSQIQEFKEAFTIMDQNRDGFIDKEDLRDTFAALGRINVKNEELEAMLKGAPGPINFTVFLTMFGEKLKGTDPEETILHAFKVFDTEGKGFVKADVIKEKLMTQADRFSEEEVKQMFAAFPPDVCGNLDYRNLCYVITHGEEKD
ncbi:myosin regulatory light chain 10 isoform X2 [Meriones unguiculatus]|uniref:myosin regulatory light chain 10 isoform X2 n=2 Tax=Gerbillinae TaxID=10045 RepID=UPI00293ECC0A|nr:myosin regulatory light chain 10 isoform X2 [Meriones unguiculatus]